MIVVNVNMPKKCIWCPIRNECKVYRDWLHDPASPISPIPMQSEDCLIEEDMDAGKKD